MDRTLPADTHKARQGLQALSLLLLEIDERAEIGTSPTPEPRAD